MNIATYIYEPLKEIIISWKNSFKLFGSEQYELFFYSTYRAILYGYEVFLKHFWWLFAIVALSEVLLPIPYSIVNPFLWVLVLFFMILSERPSVEKKDWRYFWFFIKRNLFGYLILAVSALYLYPILFMAYKFLPKTFLGLIAKNTILVFQWFLYATPFWLIFALFYIDSDGSLRALKIGLYRTICFILYNLPLMGISFFLFLYSYRLLRLIPYPNIVWILAMFFSMIAVCVIHNIYIKRVHDQFELYYYE